VKKAFTFQQRLAISLQVGDDNWFSDCPVPTAAFVEEHETTTNFGLAYIGVASLWKVTSYQIK
jgi:hypothetical protein